MQANERKRQQALDAAIACGDKQTALRLMTAAEVGQLDLDLDL